CCSSGSTYPLYRGLSAAQAATEAQTSLRLKHELTNANDSDTGVNSTQLLLQLQKIRTFSQMILPKGATGLYELVEEDKLRRMILLAKSIASDTTVCPSQTTLRTILNIFKKIQTSHFEILALPAREAWQLAAYITLEPLTDPIKSGPVRHIGAQKSGLSRDIQFDPEKSLVTIMALRNMAKK